MGLDIQRRQPMKRRLGEIQIKRPVDTACILGLPRYPDTANENHSKSDERLSLKCGLCDHFVPGHSSFFSNPPIASQPGRSFCRRFLGTQTDKLAFIRGSNWKGKLGAIVRNFGDAEIWTMAGSERQPDYCPQCGSALDIVSVKFRFGRMAIIAACPNCALEFAEEGRVARSKAITESGKFAETARGLLHLTEAAIHRLAKRLRYIFAVLFAAVVAAAALRHSIHVYGGFSREVNSRRCFARDPVCGGNNYRTSTTATQT